jgi:hypothetical protein
MCTGRRHVDERKAARREESDGELTGGDASRD